MLKRNLDRARERGFSFYVAPELEFFYFRDGDPTKTPTPLDSGSYFDLTIADVSSDLRKRTIHMLEAMGIPVEYSFHEDSPSQHEIDLRYTDALTMADNVMTTRLLVREIAQERGFYATFMPKPIEGVQGSGMHTHLSLFEGDTNAFYDAGRRVPAVEGRPRVHRRPAPPRARDHCRHQPARELLQAAHRRLGCGFAEPVRGAGVRLVGAQQPLGARCACPSPRRARRRRRASSTGRPTRRATRTSRSRCMLAAGLKGIEEGYDLPSETDVNVWEMTDEERAAEGIEPLPSSLHDALEVMERSELVAETLGEHIFEWFLRNKRSGVVGLQGAGDPVRARALPADVVRGSFVLQPLLLYPDPPPPELAQALDLAGHSWKACADEASATARRARWRGGPARSSSRPTTPRVRSRCAARCASATSRSSRSCCW